MKNVSEVVDVQPQTDVSFVTKLFGKKTLTLTTSFA